MSNFTDSPILPSQFEVFLAKPGKGGVLATRLKARHSLSRELPAHNMVLRYVVNGGHTLLRHRKTT